MLALLKKKPAIPKELINTCAKCNMTKFVDCIVNGNTHVVDDWPAIFNEYLAISGDTHISSILELLKSISIIENKLILIQICIDQLALGFHQGIADQLNKFGFRFQYTDGPDLKSQLEMTVTQSKQLLIQLNQDKIELDELRKQDSGKATVQDYESQYSAIEEFKSVSINPDTYMVSRYVADIKRMKERYKK